MQVIGVSGVRALTAEEWETVRRQLQWECLIADKVHVGCARGVDAIAREVAALTGKQLVVHQTEGYQAWQLAARSKRMVDALAADGGELHGWVNKPCPAGVTVNSWAGSGTWGTVRYAIAKGVPVELHWLIEPCPLPDWFAGHQMSLL